MQIVNISEARAHLSSLIVEVMRGRRILISKAGTPVAMLVPYHRSLETRQPGALRGQIRMADDFDELPADVAAAFGIVDP